jgi:hypothetical protein
MNIEYGTLKKFSIKLFLKLEISVRYIIRIFPTCITLDKKIIYYNFKIQIQTEFILHTGVTHPLQDARKIFKQQISRVKSLESDEYLKSVSHAHFFISEAKFFRRTKFVIVHCTNLKPIKKSLKWVCCTTPAVSNTKPPLGLGQKRILVKQLHGSNLVRLITLCRITAAKMSTIGKFDWQYWVKPTTIQI